MVAGPDDPHITCRIVTSGIFPRVFILGSSPIVKTPMQETCRVVSVINPMRQSCRHQRNTDKPIQSVALRAHTLIEPSRLTVRPLIAVLSLKMQKSRAREVNAFRTDLRSFKRIHDFDLRPSLAHIRRKMPITLGISVSRLVKECLKIDFKIASPVREGVGFKIFLECGK